ncbi:TetR/AcrR family transcriptional regulator [Coraliomargarita parva]|uniref:TetR/AcrR family transcriptional regulator n=1 Tax=Coraliomargarita parva TaxID=3014050 RepID=UPI0022B36A32|nr:TetR/AcrR family transcriptional regulator [Coraliomargarita parva]
MARRKDHTREELTELAVESGRELVRKEGPEGLTARKVASAMGYTAGTLYNLFENIDGLATAINSRTLREFAETIREILSRYKKPRRRIDVICSAYLQLHREEPHLWTLLFATPLKDRNDEYGQAVHAVFDQVVEAILPLSGRIDNARKDAKIIWATLHGTCLLNQNGKLDITEADPPELLIKRFLDQIYPR